MSKYAKYARVLELRLLRGDYALRDLPSERELAHDIGVSRMTARRVLLELMDKGILLRKPRGKVSINRRHAKFAGQLRLAFLGPAFSSADFESWRFAVQRSAARLNASVRDVDYVHWNDPVVTQTLGTYDGVFLAFSAEPIPDLVMDRLSKAKNLIALGADLTDRGVPSIRLLPPTAVQQLGEHLYSLGHRRIDCLNAQPHDREIVLRLEHWSQWQRIHKIEGRLIDEPVEPGMHVGLKAREVMKRLLDQGQYDATALICITDSAADGATRALYDHGLKIGKDVSVCAVEGGELGALHIPSRTMLKLPDPDPYIAACIDWFKRPDEPWVGPLLIQPANVTLYEGESTGPVPVSK